MNRNTDTSSINTITFKCLLVLVILAVLSITISFIHQLYIKNEQTTAAIVNVSGRQRMLSQRTAQFSLRLVNSKDKDERDELRADLLDSIELFEKSHFGLINGDEEMNLPGKSSSKVKDIFFNSPMLLDKQVRDYVNEVKKLAHEKEVNLTQDNPHLSYIVDTASSSLLKTLDIVVKQYQIDSESFIVRHKLVEVGLLGLIIIVLILSWQFIFRSMIYNIKQEHDFIRLLHVAATASNEAKNIEEASNICLKLICDHTGWPIGHLYVIEEGQTDKLISTKTWYLKDADRFKKFKEVTETTDFTGGTGLPGRVLLSSKPVWIMDATKDQNFPRAKLAIDIGVRAGFAFPILSGKEVVAVMEFFSDKVVKQDKRLLEIMAQVGTKLGRVVERKRASDAIQEANEELETKVNIRTKEVKFVNKILEEEIEVRKEAETLVRKQLQELEEINKELESFTYTASHDMQEPLRTISSYCQLLRSDVGGNISDQAVEDINFITDASGRMRKLIQDLLMLSRSGRVALQMEAVDLNECMHNVVHDLEAQIIETGGSVKWNDLPTVQGDFIHLSRVFQNLVDNSLKFHGESTPIVQITAQKISDAWEIVLVDNGIGMEKKFLEKIFTPFEKLHSSSVYAGSGVGLSICRKILHRHGSEIKVESTIGKGSSFIFTLKL